MTKRSKRIPEVSIIKMTPPAWGGRDWEGHDWSLGLKNVLRQAGGAPGRPLDWVGAQ